MASDAQGNQWYQPLAGLSNVGSYQVSGIPWVSSSIAVQGLSSNTPTEVQFPQVTKFVQIKNLSANPMRVGFSQNGVLGSNYYILGNLETLAVDLRVSKMYLLGNTNTATSASVVAGLTGIQSSTLQNNWSGSAGVG